MSSKSCGAYMEESICDSFAFFIFWDMVDFVLKLKKKIMLGGLRLRPPKSPVFVEGFNPHTPDGGSAPKPRVFFNRNCCSVFRNEWKINFPILSFWVMVVFRSFWYTLKKWFSLSPQQMRNVLKRFCELFLCDFVFDLRSAFRTYTNSEKKFC